MPADEPLLVPRREQGCDVIDLVAVVFRERSHQHHLLEHVVRRVILGLEEREGGVADQALRVGDLRNLETSSGFQRLMSDCRSSSEATCWNSVQASRNGKVPLISLPPHELLPRLFQKEMVRRNMVWRTAMETSFQDSVSIYVRNGHGAGLAVQTQELQRDSGLRLLPLSGFLACRLGCFGAGSSVRLRKCSLTN